MSTPIGLRDRALIALMVFSFARIGAALAMRVEDVFVQNRRLWVRLREKGGKRHEIPCHHTLEEYLHAYLDGVRIGDDPKGPLFRTIGRGTGRLTRAALPQANAYAMVQRRTVAAGIGTRIGNHSFRATGITAYLKNGGTWRMPRRWPTTPARAPPSSTIAGETTSAWTKWSGSESKESSIALLRHSRQNLLCDAISGACSTPCKAAPASAVALIDFVTETYHER